MGRATFQKLYLRDTVPNINGGTKPSGQLGIWDYARAAGIGSNAESLVPVGNNANISRTVTGNAGSGSTPKSYLPSQFLSPALKRQKIEAGNWELGDSISVTVGSFDTKQAQAGLYLVNGATGAIRSTIFSQQNFGTAQTTAGYIAALSTTIAGSAAYCEDGDYLCLELGVEIVRTAVTASVTSAIRFGNSTAVTTDNTALTTPRSYLKSPLPLDYYGLVFFFRNTASDVNPGAIVEKLLSLNQGTGNATSVTNTTASGTLIQCTNTAGGSNLAWFTPPLRGASINDTFYFNINGQESATAANAGRYLVVYRTDTDGNDLETLATLNQGVEYTTTAAPPTAEWSANLTATFANGERIQIALYIANVGTMGGSRTVTNNFDTGVIETDSWIYSPTASLSILSEPAPHRHTPMHLLTR